MEPGDQVAAAAQLACLLEVSASKPGNVSPQQHFRDVRYEDFLASAVAIGRPLGAAARSPLGGTIRAAVEATARWVPSNTNLGIVLLLAPLAHAALRTADRTDPGCRWTRGALRRGLQGVLNGTSVNDAREVYAAIRIAAPGGLGRVDAQDVGAVPTGTLLEVMRLAADRDGIAREYATGFRVTFEVGVPALSRARADDLSWEDAVVETFLTLLASAPDTHVARRAGDTLAREISGRAVTCLAAGGVRTPAGRSAVASMDRDLRGGQNRQNPGTSADLTAATIFVTLLEGGWRHKKGGDRGAHR